MDKQKIFTENIKNLKKLIRIHSAFRRYYIVRYFGKVLLQGSLFLGKGQPTILGVYSDYSSHPCHGASEIIDGNPAFGIEIETTWCFYFHMDWGSAWKFTANPFNKGAGKCCVEEPKDICTGGWQTSCGCKTSDDKPSCCHTYCAKWEQFCLKGTFYYTIDRWNPISGASQSSGDCGYCYTLKGYIKDGVEVKDPFGVSFFQSQSLLITP